MSESIKPASQQQLQAKLQELEQEIESINKEMKKNKELRPTSFDKLHEIIMGAVRDDMSLEEKKELFAEEDELSKDPLIAEWKGSYKDLSTLIRQTNIIEEDLRKMSAKASSSAQPSEGSVPGTAALEPPACATAKSKFFFFVIILIFNLFWKILSSRNIIYVYIHSLQLNHQTPPPRRSLKQSSKCWRTISL